LPGSACVPQAAAGILPGAGFREWFATDQRSLPFRQGNFFPGSACVPQAAAGILPGAGFREWFATDQRSLPFRAGKFLRKFRWGQDS